MTIKVLELREGYGKSLCSADVEIETNVRIFGIGLFLSNDDDGSYWIGLPRQRYQDKQGVEQWKDILALSRDCKAAVRDAICAAYKASQIAGVAAPVGDEGDPFAE